ncbi:VanW family protein [Xylanimonas cellulosilytica DSM 15894]|uniref:VanW family protein n=1 Tax=Xylanimonas cellulosilytica (strain DSM 15894 / JCM 12276 / CECT 5975 / KCTC 9989 / LMG 20990 / NBRC 107835 / XIL07) TaxID=446471 RepID=D1BY68_XYLCX|nr:VanW family protein [Xylanimonas cellulosilytica]ACZ29911.1 VanW family protein [Xylanimonas cellulosilytica DSM 15894]
MSHDSPTEQARRTRRLWWTAAGVATLAAAYGAAQWSLADQVPTGATVAGIDVGGLRHDDAVAALDDAAALLADQPVPVTAGTAETTVLPTDAGLALDAAATIEPLTRFTLHPARLWTHLRGAAEIEPAVTIDRDLLDAAASRLSTELVREPVDGAVVFADGEPVVTPAEPGTQVDPDAVGQVLATGWLAQDHPLELPHEPVEPAITQELTDAAYAAARQIVASPVVVDAAGQHAELPASALADATAFEVVDGALVPTFDGDALLAAVVERTQNLLDAPVNARFQVTGGRPQVTGGTPGTTIDPAALVEAVQAAALGEDRTAVVDVVQQDPEVTAESLEALGVNEVVARFSTSLTANRVRTDNIRLGSERITGTLIRPGETFSLLEALGPITTANGFGNAPVIVGGQFVPGVGGGLSQLATNVFNAGFFAGFEIVEHRPHSVWIPRYPAGREATIFTGSIDLRFRNNTPYGAVLHAFVADGQLTVQVWSTEHFRVETTQSERRNVVPAVTNHSTAAGCTPRAAGSDGFTITNTRRVYRGSTLVIDEAHTWTYRADHGTSCGPAEPPPAPEADAAPEDSAPE